MSMMQKSRVLFPSKQAVDDNICHFCIFILFSFIIIANFLKKEKKIETLNLLY